MTLWSRVKRTEITALPGARWHRRWLCRSRGRSAGSRVSYRESLPAAAGYWRGVPLGGLLRGSDPQRVSVVADGERWTYGELDDRADRLAAGLADLGVRRGDRVAGQLSGAVAYVVPDVVARYDHRELAAEVSARVPELRHVLVAGDPGPYRALASVGAAPRELTSAWTCPA